MTKSELWKSITDFLYTETQPILVETRLIGVKSFDEKTVMIKCVDEDGKRWAEGRLTGCLTRYLKKAYDKDTLNVKFTF